MLKNAAKPEGELTALLLPREWEGDQYCKDFFKFFSICDRF
jgi:hypothetical protein